MCLEEAPARPTLWHFDQFRNFICKPFSPTSTQMFSLRLTYSRSLSSSYCTKAQSKLLIQKNQGTGYLPVGGLSPKGGVTLRLQDLPISQINTQRGPKLRTDLDSPSLPAQLQKNLHRASCRLGAGLGQLCQGVSSPSPAARDQYSGTDTSLQLLIASLHAHQ